jgi:hypothetical protein
MHKPLFLVTAGSVAAVGALVVASALPAGAATAIRAETMAACTVGAGSTSGTPCTPPATTPVTFTVSTTGTLSINAPVGPVDLGAAVVGSTTTYTNGNFGAVTVIDNRAIDGATWTATVASTDFANSVTSTDIIPVGDATYTTGAITSANGGTSATSVPGAAVALPLTTGAQDVVTEASFLGDNGATWSPTINIAVPTTAVVGTYDATVTHSVS